MESVRYPMKMSGCVKCDAPTKNGWMFCEFHSTPEKPNPRRCVKCGSEKVVVKYVEQADKLYVTCECGYRWYAPCLDAKP